MTFLNTGCKSSYEISWYIRFKSHHKYKAQKEHETKLNERGPDTQFRSPI